MTEPIDVTNITQGEIHKLLQQANRAKGLNSVESVPGKVFLQVLGSGTRGTPSSLYVFTDNSKYLFNCGEGSQRLAHEHHLKLSKLDHILFTTPTWKNMGGLPGMLLTIQDYCVSEINIHGPKGITELFNATKRFVLLKDLNVKQENCDDNQEFIDSCMTIKYVNLFKKYDDESDDDSDTDDIDFREDEFNRNDNLDLNFHKLPSESSSKREDEKISVDKVRSCLAYICKLHPKPGGININKLNEKLDQCGVKKGPFCSLLKAGFDVKLEIKSKITSESEKSSTSEYICIKSCDVCEPETPGPVFIVLEIPDEDYLDSLTNNKEFEAYQSTGRLENQADFIFHFTPENILNTQKYRGWLKNFSKKTKNIIINEYNNCYNYEALHRIQHQLTLLSPSIFPPIHDKNFDNKMYENIDRVFDDDNLDIHRAKTLNLVHLRPLDGLDSSVVVKIDKDADVKEVFNVDGFEKALTTLKININNQLNDLKDKSEYPKLLVLGTGSCMPSKVRNVSGMLLRIDENTSIILDCGEGTAGQIIRFFGVKEADRVLASIKAIYVSHLHADHHLGLLGLLQERQRTIKDPVYIFAPKQIESWLKFYHRKFEKIKNMFNLVPNQFLMMDDRKIQQEIYEEINKVLKIKEINTVEVDHCMHAFGVSLILQSGQKIVWSGDTKPCTSLVDLGKNCDLLIHEATMEDNLADDAMKKMHSTISQAIDIGEKMNSKFTLLTHFSQRYSKMPILPDSSAGFNLNNVGISFDNMQINLSELSLLPLFYPCLGFMFSDFCLSLENKAKQRLIKEQKK